jgi:excisionase family DNA binding protein
MKNIQKLDSSIKTIVEFLEERDELMLNKYLTAVRELVKTSTYKEDIELLTIEETAKLLKVSKPTVHGLRTSGQIKAILVNSQVRYKKEDIMNYLNKNSK